MSTVQQTAHYKSVVTEGHISGRKWLTGLYGCSTSLRILVLLRFWLHAEALLNDEKQRRLPHKFAALLFFSKIVLTCLEAHHIPLQICDGNMGNSIVRHHGKWIAAVLDPPDQPSEAKNALRMATKSDSNTISDLISLSTIFFLM